MQLLARSYCYCSAKIRQSWPQLLRHIGIIQRTRSAQLLSVAATTVTVTVAIEQSVFRISEFNSICRGLLVNSLTKVLHPKQLPHGDKTDEEEGVVTIVSEERSCT